MNKKLVIGIGAGIAVAALALGLGLGLGLKHNHTYSDKWTNDATYHWHAATCDHKDEVSEKAEHTLNGNECTVCGYKKPEEKPQTVEVTEVTLNKTELTLTEGGEETLTVTVKPDNATDKTVVWTSSDENVATVSDGKVTAKSAGSATITAKSGDKSATCTVTVKAPVKHTVTEDEWEAAFALFCDEPYAEGKPPLTFTCTGVINLYPDSVMNLYIDCENKKMCFKTEEGNGRGLLYYSWVNENGDLIFSENGHARIEDDRNIYELYVAYFEMYAGTMFMESDFVGKYGEFTYDADTNKYKAANGCEVMFADGKIQSTTCATVEGDIPGFYVYDFVYSASITIPDELLNYPLD